MSINQEALLQHLAQQQLQLEEQRKQIEELLLKNQNLESRLINIDQTVSKVDETVNKEKELRINAEQQALAVKRQEEAAKSQMLKQQQLKEAQAKQARICLAHSVDENGDTPLHHACRKQNVSEINQLIRDGADVNKTNKAGCTCLDVASMETGVKVSNMGFNHRMEQTRLQEPRIKLAEDIVLLIFAYGGRSKITSLGSSCTSLESFIDMKTCPPAFNNSQRSQKISEQLQKVNSMKLK